MRIIRLITGLTIILSVYSVAYAFTVEAKAGACLGCYSMELEPNYGFGGNLSEVLFRPAHYLDRRLRSSYWRWSIVDGLPRRSSPS